MKTVLVLEKELPVLKVVRHELKKYNIVEASSADEALLLTIDLDYQVDLLVAHLTAPIRSGLQVALLLRTKILQLPVILTSGDPVSSWNDRDSADLQKLGWHGLLILQEPFRPRLFQNALWELIEQANAEISKTA